MWGLDAKDWVLVGATVAGPILAVQAQKWVERAREGTSRRVLVFTTLMATRQSRISMEHVRALNSIDLAFYGRRVLGITMRRPKSQAVLDAWHDYHAHLSLSEERRPKNDAEFRDWTGRGDELFTNLLERLAAATNFKFDRQQLKAGSYSPEAHGTVELEQQAVRKLALDVMSGQKPLAMEVKAWPIDAAAVEQQRNGQAELVRNQRELMGSLALILGRLTDRAVGVAGEAPVEVRCDGGPDRQA
ncbi:DUF6680 family protein [Pandoraea soli]|uniref:DUF6680 domain-containing protein n=1 Tax=Pandoraea soli TaxID=2508293 RepID=A0ABY6WAF1_9BURK|nr:DUF6680 family protein [Pandoraea soli]VVE46386.1 hypothetical protein PSO31014_04398 [Pandoraea soli]